MMRKKKKRKEKIILIKNVKMRLNVKNKKLKI